MHACKHRILMVLTSNIPVRYWVPHRNRPAQDKPRQNREKKKQENTEIN